MKLLMEGFQPGWIIESKELVEVELPKHALVQEGLSEATGPRTVQRTRVRAIIQEADNPNQNGRSYPRALFERVLAEDSDFMKRLRRKEVLGEVEHPESGNTHLGRASHLWESVWPDWATGKIYGECILLRTPEGARLDELAEVGHPLGFSSRGRGEVTQRNDGIEEVKVDEYFLDTFDAVAKPSVEIARMEHASVGQESRTPAAGVRTESRERSATMSGNAGMAVMAGQLLARAETTMAGVQESLAKKGDISSLVEAQAQVSGLLADVGSASIPPELREQFAEIRGRLKETSVGIGQKVRSLRNGKRRSGGGGRLAGTKDRAATEIIEALMQRNKGLRRQLESRERPVVDDSRYEVAVQLGEELLRRARDLQEERDSLQEQLDAAVELVEAVVRKTRSGKVQNRIKAALQDSVIRNNGQARKLLESCRTTQEVDQAVTLIKSLVGRSAAKDPLPPVGGKSRRTLAEGQRGQQPRRRTKQGFPQATGGTKQFGESLIGRLAERETRFQSDTLNG